MAGDLGCFGILVDAKAESVRFYELGFVGPKIVAGELGDRPRTTLMFLEIGPTAKPKPGSHG